MIYFWIPFAVFVALAFFHTAARALHLKEKEIELIREMVILSKKSNRTYTQSLESPPGLDLSQYQTGIFR